MLPVSDVTRVGNYGDQNGVTTEPTIRTPAIAKNVLAVGATWNAAALSGMNGLPATLRMDIAIPTPGGTASVSSTASTESCCQLICLLQHSIRPTRLHNERTGG
jgi:hypothetical protein